MTERAQLLHAIVVFKFVLGDDETASFLAWQRTFGVVLALLEVGLQGIELHHLRAAVDLIVARDVEAAEEIAEDSRDRSEIGGGDGLSVDGTGRLPAQPFLDAPGAESVFARDDLQRL